MNPEISVSVLCLTFNHEKYIRSALEGFVSQQTNFKFEVLVHDDASTDGTAAIVREYEQKYPEIIKGIYQTENQHSKNPNITRSFLYPLARGKYIALCEGDDYWIDPLKLQKQYDQLENHPGIDICSTSAVVTKNGKIKKILSPKKENCIVSPGEIIAGGGGFVATASLMIRRENAFKYPGYEQILSLDYVRQIKGAIPDGMLFLKDVTAVYRLGCAGSWTSRMRKDLTKYYAHVANINSMLARLNQDTDFIYDVEIKRHIRENECSVLLSNKEYRRVKNEYADVYSKYDAQRKIVVSSYIVSPYLGKIIKLFDALLKKFLSCVNSIYINKKYRGLRRLLSEN